MASKEVHGTPKHMREIRERVNNRPSLYLNDDYVKQNEVLLKTINDFINLTQVPAWYRGNSNFQLEAANNLFFAIRDDTEQRTAHRVRACLKTIGLTPMVNDKHLKYLMRLSGGNDLAFLWFLMEMYYREPNDVGYTLNQQLILSSIAHLDTITTLRELDRLLPPGHMSLRDMKRRAQAAAEKARKENYRKRKDEEIDMQIKSLGGKCRSPYFMPFKNVYKYGHSLMVPPPDFKVKFLYYENYKNPNFVVPNESNRWYAQYKLQPSKRIADGVVNEQIKFIFEEEFEFIQHDIIEQSIVQMFKSNDSIKSTLTKDPALCSTHRNELAIKELKRMQRVLDMRERCLYQINAEEHFKKERIKRMVEQLEQCMENHIIRLRRRYAIPDKRTRIVVIDKNDRFAEYLIVNSQEDLCCSMGANTGCPPKPCKTGKPPPNHTAKRRSKRRSKEKAHNNKHMSIDPFQKLCVDNEEYIATHGCTKMDCEGNIIFLQRKKPPEKPKKPPICGVGRAISKSELTYYRNKRLTSMHLIDEYKEVAISPVPSQQFFVAPTPHEPYKFNYREIYKIDYNYDGIKNGVSAHKEDNDNINNGARLAAGQNDSSRHYYASGTRNEPKCNQMQVHSNYRRCTKSKDIRTLDDIVKRKELYLKALGLSAKEVPKLMDETPDIMAAVTKNALHTWKYRLATKSDQINAYINRKARRAAQLNELELDIPKQKYYDCEDQELMLRMLKACFNFMKKDTKFVLASMKDAHKLPIFLEWICQRYGKRYSEKERLRQYDFSYKIFTTLQKCEMKTIVPNTTELGGALNVDYSCRKYTENKAKKIKQSYYDQVNEAMMAQTRIYWFAMHPFLCSKGPPRNTFFAYMPSRVNNIHHFRQWKPNEFMDAVQQWEKQRANRYRGVRLSI